MRNVFYLLMMILFQFGYSNQKSFINEIGINGTKDTLNNDLILVKPLINFNEPDGGYYSEYYTSAFHFIYCGAVVKNIGNQSVSNVFLEIDFLNYDNSILSTYYSDTITVLNLNQLDTLMLPQEINPGYWYKIQYKVLSDSLDENPINNIDTIPGSIFFYDMWSYESRSIRVTDTLDISKITNFHSGDFIGGTLKFLTETGGSHEIVSMGVYITDHIPDSLSIYGKIYQNGTLIDSVQIVEGSINPPSWIYANFNFSYFNSLIAGNTIYIGVELVYPDGTNIPIGIDTSLYHNFEAESIANIGSNWTTLDFVPLIRLICDPESIQNLDYSEQINVYPNPTSGKLKINAENIKNVYVMDDSGKPVLNLQNVDEIDLRNLSCGIYFIRITTDKFVQIKKVVLN